MRASCHTYHLLKLPLGPPAVPDESVNEQFILTEPDTQVKDNQPGILRVYAIPVTTDYSESALKTEVQDRLKAISSTNFESWSPSLTASRHLLGAKGVYANYSGTMANGVKVGGRIHCTSIDKVLYCIEIVYPLAYKKDYEEVFKKMRIPSSGYSKHSGNAIT